MDIKKEQQEKEDLTTAREKISNDRIMEKITYRRNVRKW